MKRIARLPILAGAIVAAIAVTSLAPTPARRVTAQVTRYYYQGNTYNGLYGQGLYSSYGQGRGYYNRVGHTTYRYSGYGVSPYRYGTSSRYGYGTNYNYQTRSRLGYGHNPYIRSYGGGARYYQPYTGGLYFGFGSY